MSQRSPDDPNGIQVNRPLKGETGITADKPLSPDGTKPPSVRRRIVRVVLMSLILPLLGCGIPSFLVYNCSNPRDQLEVSINGVPKGTNFACVVAESQGVTRVMDWSWSYFLGPQRSHPADHNISRRHPEAPDDGPRVRATHWEFGERYGVVTRRDGKWFVTWFNADNVPLKDRSILVGGGRVSFDLTQGRTEALPDDEVERLGLSRWPLW
jgi:hypothetical protein